MGYKSHNEITLVKIQCDIWKTMPLFPLCHCKTLRIIKFTTPKISAYSGNAYLKLFSFFLPVVSYTMLAVISKYF